MSKNRIRELRTEHGLTQGQLADIVGTSQQQIQRIEAGFQAARLDLAARICAALGNPMHQVFPATKKIVTRLRRNKKLLDYSTADERYVRAMEGAGIDMDPEVWTVKFRLRGGAWGYHQISGIEQKRLWPLLQEGDTASFIVFDSATKRVAMNLHHVLAWQFLWDAPNQISSAAEKYADELRVIFADTKNPVTFMVDADQAKFGDEANDGWPTQLQGLLFTLETVGGESDTIVSFADVDGEHAFLRSAEVSMIEVPLWAVEPEEGEIEEVNVEEDNRVGQNLVKASKRLRPATVGRH